MLEGKREPSALQVEKLADRLAIPCYAFFLPSFEVAPTRLIDFRRNSPGPYKLGLNAAFFEHCFRLQNFARELFAISEMKLPLELFSTELEENPEQVAQAFRKILKLDDFQFDREFSASRFYSEFRNRVEQLGIFVVQGSMRDNNIRGCAIFDDSAAAHMIIINTLQQNHQSRSFTLAHELAHIILKQSGISDPITTNNKVEIFCNRFAINLLAPREQFYNLASTQNITNNYDTAMDSAKNIARTLKISITATLIRLHEFKFVSKDILALWYPIAQGRNSPDALKDIRRGGEPSAGKNAIARLGARFCGLIRDAVNEKRVNAFDVYTQTGMSESTIKSMITVSDERLRAMSAEGDD